MRWDLRKRANELAPIWVAFVMAFWTPVLRGSVVLMILSWDVKITVDRHLYGRNQEDEEGR